MPYAHFVFAAAFLLAAGPAAAQRGANEWERDGGRTTRDAAGTERHHDSSGRLSGSSERSSNGTTTNRYDERGRNAGSSERSGDGATTYHYDASGRISGSSRVLSNGQTVHYDAAGRLMYR